MYKVSTSIYTYFAVLPVHGLECYNCGPSITPCPADPHDNPPEKMTCQKPDQRCYKMEVIFPLSPKEITKGCAKDDGIHALGFDVNKRGFDEQPLLGLAKSRIFICEGELCNTGPVRPCDDNGEISTTPSGHSNSKPTGPTTTTSGQGVTDKPSSSCSDMSSNILQVAICAILALMAAIF